MLPEFKVWDQRSKDGFVFSHANLSRLVAPESRMVVLGGPSTFHWRCVLSIGQAFTSSAG